MKTGRPSVADRRAALRRMIGGTSLVVAPGVFDALGAKMVEQAGFGALYLTGNGVSASLIGEPDVGLITMTEMVDTARRVASVVSIPVISDADTGYGNAVNVARTVQEFEQAGVAAIHLEDQVSPKRCGELPGARPVIPLAEMLGKLEAALAARTDPNFLIIGRTDAFSGHGIEEALRRARAYAEVGVDVVFVHLGRTGDLAQVPRSVSVPTMVNMDESAEASRFTAREIEQLGYRIAIYPGSLRYSVAWAMGRALAQLKETGSTVAVRDQMAPFRQYNDILELKSIESLESRFLRGASEG